jgi:hypothetical protein
VRPDVAEVCHPGEHTFGEKCISNGDTRTYITYGKKHQNGFGRVPMEVVADQRLEHLDVRVYAAMAGFERRGSIHAGLRLISRTVGAAINTVRKSMATLDKCGHLEVYKADRGERARYRLMSPVFRAAVGVQSEPAECMECHRPCRKLSKAGHCRTCATRLDRERQWTAARAVLGHDATLEQIAMHLHIDKITRPWLATARAVDQRRVA